MPKSVDTFEIKSVDTRYPERNMAPNHIREIREERAQIVPAAFTVSAVARRVGVTEAALRRWEQGTARPTRRHSRALARELGVDVKALGLVEADVGPVPTEADRVERRARRHEWASRSTGSPPPPNQPAPGQGEANRRLRP